MGLRRGNTRLGLGRNQGLRRKTAWGIGPGSSAATAISSTTAVLIGAGAVSTGDGQTVVRLRGELLLTLITATGSLDGFRGAFGIGIVQNPAFTAGIGSVPTPVTEAADENWLYHRFFTIVANISTEADFGLSAAMRLEVDSKAMRKFDSGVTLYAALEVTEVGAAVMDASFDSRVLVKLP